MPDAKKTLSGYEESASKTYGTTSTGSAENAVFENRVSGKTKRKKKKGPLFLLSFLLLAGGGIIFASQSLMPFAIVNRFIEEFNSIGISSTLRADNILDYQLEYAGGFFSLSEDQRTAFSENEIDVVDYTAGGKRSTALIFKTNSNKDVPVVSKKVLEKSSGSSIVSAIKTSSSKYTSLEEPISVEKAMENSKFKTNYTTASKTYRGGNSGWYDTLTNLTEARLSISRTRYSAWTSHVLKSGEKEAFRKLASSKRTTDRGISDYGTYSEVDSDGNETTNTNNGLIDSENLASATTVEGVRKALNSKITSVAKVAATAGCAGVEIISAIQTVMSVQQAIQYLNLATGYFEATQKAQAGYGNDSPLHNYNMRLTEVDPETGKTAMNSAGIQSLFSGSTISSSDESVKVTNFETLGSSLGELTGNIRMTAKAFEACSYVRMGVSAINFTTAILNFVPILGQGVAAIRIVAKVVAKLALGIAVGEIVAFIVPKIVAQVAKNIINDVATDCVGEDLGNALSSGANKYLGGNFQTGGGSGASKEKLVEYFHEKETVLAEEANYQRTIKNPLDTSSEYTFLGSIMYSLIPLATSTSLGSLVKSFGGLITSSAAKLLPTASAVAETNLVNSVGDCPTLESAGMVGDAYCNPYYITDESTIKDTPLSIIEKIRSIDSNNFITYNSNGSVEVNPDSNLGKYIKYCGQRNSSFGLADANIASDITQNSGSLVANLPLVGDISQLISAASEAKNMPWISGSACSASSENPLWEENKYYQRFAEDQRLLESAGVIEKSAQTAMLEDYYKNNPLDNSYEGIIARFSGMTKENVVATLEIIDGLEFLANYEPKGRLLFNNQDERIFDDSEKLAFESSGNRLYLFYDKLLQRIRQRSLNVAQG